MYDVIVIGGGTAGLVTASGCARLGRRVALVEKNALGGDCLWTGCVPTKALVATAKILHQAKHAAAFGLKPTLIEFSPREIMESMRETIRVTSRHDDPEKFRRLGINVLFGEARFVSRREVDVRGTRMQAKDIVIATGSRTRVPQIPGLGETGFVDHASFLTMNDFPRSVVILGGGAIGIEFAQIFRRFGAEVTVVEVLDEIVNKEDPDMIAIVRKTLASEGIEILTRCKATRIERRDASKVVRVESINGTSRELLCDEIFVASGRIGNVESLNLDAAGVKTRHNFVVANQHLQTSASRVWACGDIHGGLQFTHVAAYEAVKLVRNMLFPFTSAVDYSNVPWATYTDPEIAHLGWTEEEAIAQLGQKDVRVYKTELAEVDRAVVDRTTNGLVKIITNAKGYIVGAHVAAPNASTLIEQLVLARRTRTKIGTLAQMVSPYPSLADAIQKTAAGYYADLGSSWIGRIAQKIAGLTQ